MVKKALFPLFLVSLPLIGAEVVGVYSPSHLRKPVVQKRVIQKRYYPSLSRYSTAPQWKTDFYFLLVKEDYREYQGSNVLDRDYSDWGDLKGFGVRGLWNNLVYGKLEYAYGDSHYVGATWSGEPLENDQTGTWIFNIEGGVKLQNGILLGIGYRVWNRGKSNYIGDYDEVYSWSYLQMGYKLNIPLGNKGEFDPEISYQYSLSSQMKAYMDTTITFDLGNVNGYRVELPFSFNLSQNLYLYLFYRYQYWDVGGSRVITATVNGKSVQLYEPPSTTSNHYLGVGIRAYF
ncbi:MAG: hypothetical protein C6I01_05045 [Epsilonproteobacteria bacterium]|nr:hypothetical protein [Campylobacterota bacterium]NPA89537.1 hypothetical protein [Campylobacterota bacterium]